jgi:uncharacterized protein GlcG (DUF336 family)
MRLLARSFPLAALASASFGQGLITQRSLSNDAAVKIAQGVLEKCNSQGYKISLSILDASGAVKLQVRGDGTGPHTLEHSRRKAYTALTFKRMSAETADAWAKRGGVALVIEGTVGAAGGVPIRAGEEVIGAVGVSGALGGEKDEACANFGISKVAEILK